MALFLTKAALVIFFIVPLVIGVIALALGALWLQVQDAKKEAPVGGDAPNGSKSETHRYYSRRRVRLTSAKD